MRKGHYTADIYIESAFLMKSIATSSYSVHFNETSYMALNRHLNGAGYSKLFILVDANTHQLCLPPFLAKLTGKYPIEIIEIRPGEAHKTIPTCSEVWEAMSDLGADRKSLLINLGGGVVTDLGGFVASAFKRGVDFINVPTTLLAMVDASIGGKTGVDLGKLKNQIGFIKQPEMVLVISSFLQTLDQRQLYSGLAEMLKHGLIQDRAYWDSIKQITTFDTLDRYIYDSVVIKNEIVLKDPTEQNLRKILNFGHTLGHAIESYFLDSDEGPALLHGEAIAAGMILEGFLSHTVTGLDRGAMDEIKATFMERYKKLHFSEKAVTGILDLMKFDKKNSHGNINFVLLKNIGEPIIDCLVPWELFADAFAYYRE